MQQTKKSLKLHKIFIKEKLKVKSSPKQKTSNSTLEKNA